MVSACLRPTMPALYNSARLFEEPVPRAELTVDVTAPAEENAQTHDDLQSTFYVSGELDNPSQEDVKPIIPIDGEDLIAFELLFNENQNENPDENIANDEIDPLAINEEQQDNLEQPENDENVENVNAYSTSIPESFANANFSESTRIDAIVALDVVEPGAAGLNVTTNSKEAQQIEAENVNLRELNNNDTVDEREALRQREIAENVENLLLYGQRVAVDDLEYVHIPGQELKAIEYEPNYEVKSNDLLCGNMPFKLQFNGDREFMAVKGDSYEEVKLKGKAAEGLVKMNKEKRGEIHDLRFLKGLMIGFLSVQKIKEFVANEDIGEALLNLFKGRYYL